MFILFIMCEYAKMRRMTAVDLRERYQVTVPAEVRQALHVEVGDRLEFQVTEDGDVRVRGLKTIPADQAWFWTPEWQAMEREADEDIAAGRMLRFHSTEEMDAYLDSLDAQTDAR